MILCFPDPYPDELLYSIWARYSDRVRYPREKYVLMELFGRHRISLIIDLPRYIGYFAKQLPVGYNFTADDFIDQHTLFPLYSAFMSQERATVLRELMTVNELRGLSRGFYRRFAIANSLVHPMLCLRYCPICWQEDRTNFGEAYWHRSHQVLGFDVCPLHGTFIENSPFRIREKVPEKQLFSAQRIQPVAAPRRADLSSIYGVLKSIAENISYLLEHPKVALSPTLFCEKYRTLLAKRGFLVKERIVRIVDFLNDFEAFYTSSLLRQLNCVVSKDQTTRSWLIRLVSVAHGQQHPLHHLLTIHFLGATVKDFFGQDLTLPSPFGDGPWPCLNPACEHFQQKYITTYQIIHIKRKRDKPIGIFACTCGFMYSRIGPDSLPEDAFRRDKVLSYGAIWEAKLKELWANPTLTRREIAGFLSTSEGNIRNRAIKLQLANPRISPRNKKGMPVRLIHDTQWCRTKWLTLVESTQEEGRTPLREKAPGLYRWLYRNDQDWFFAHRPPSKPSRKLEDQRKS